MRSRTGLLTMTLVALVLAAGCASSGKLAKKSQEQLEEGDVRKAYQTAMRAVGKNPYDPKAVAALQAAAQAVVNHEAARFRSLLAAGDTTEAARVALDIEDVRHTVAGSGITLGRDERFAADERTVRHAAAMRAGRAGDVLFDEGHPKTACASYAQAQRFEPDNPQWEASLAEARAAGTDRVLVLPYVCETRANVDARALSDEMYASVLRYANEHLEFTEIADPGRVWGRLVNATRGPGRSVTREAAMMVGQEREATRVAWSRIYGDRIESNSEIRTEVLYRKVIVRTPEGTHETRWEPMPVLIRVEDRWVSVALECEVYSIAEDRIVARRSTDHGAGLRIVSVISPLPGPPEDWVLYTPEQRRASARTCEERETAWRDAFGTLTVELLAQNAQGKAPTTGPTWTSRGVRYGRASHGGRGYSVCYGSLPGESTLVQVALGDAWKELAAVLAVSDES